jgi:tetratricopeptide (TPR) repeat protein
MRRGRRATPLQDSLAQFLTDRAQSTGSKLLSLVAERVAVDPFEKVKKMVKDLIVKLMEEATAETEHKGWCDAEVGANKVSRDAKTEEVNKLTSDVEDLTAEIAELGQRVSELASSIADLTSAMATSAAERAAAKEKNEQTIADAKAAIEAVQHAIGVLKEYYAKAGESTALAQQTPAEDAPETFNAPYRGMASEGGNVVDFLEVILADFTRLQTDTENTESSEADEFKKFSFESEKDKALKENEKAHKEDKISQKESELTSTKADLDATQGQLDKAVAYYEKLKPNCVDTGITYEDRVKRREEEIQSLQEALKILTGEDVAAIAQIA